MCIFLKDIKNGFNVLAGSKGIGFKVGAFAEVLTGVKPSDADSVSCIFGIVDYTIITENLVSTKVLNAKKRLCSPLPP